MSQFLISRRRIISMLVLIGFSLHAAVPAVARSPVKLTTWTGAIDFSNEGPSLFTLQGNASHLGQFTAEGEVIFISGEDGSLVGEGVVVFEAANGDLLVGSVSWDVDSKGGDFRTSAIHFAWADSVEFSDGTVVTNTGRFVKDRPPGLVVIAIIAILIGLLIPAVQKA